MGVYYNLSCKKCEMSLHFGKKLARGNDRLELQGLHLESSSEWVNDGRAFIATQAFLQQHEGHELIFASDQAFPRVQLYGSEDVDSLLQYPGRDETEVDL